MSFKLVSLSSFSRHKITILKQLKQNDIFKYYTQLASTFTLSLNHLQYKRMKQNNHQDITLHHTETFESAGLNSYLVKCYEALGYRQPTPVQYYSIHTYLKQQTSLIVQSKSGTGKTLSYISLILTHMLQNHQNRSKIKYLILLPTRQLALQVYQSFKKVTDFCLNVQSQGPQQTSARAILKNIRPVLAIGGIPFEDDRTNYIQKGGQVLIGTIGRIVQWFSRGLASVDELKMCVLDEGDNLIESKTKGFQQLLWKILNKPVENMLNMIYSATYSPKVLHRLTLRHKYTLIQTLARGQQLRVNITNRIDQFVFQQPHGQQQNTSGLIELENIKKYQFILQNDSQNSILTSKISSLIVLLKQLQYQRCLVFVQKKTLLQPINERLIEASLDPLLIHGSLSQAARIRLMNQINHSKLIISSDLLARGIDLELDLVILFDVKKNETFWHRIGRTGRFGRIGVAISLQTVDGWQMYQKDEVQKQLESVGFTNKEKEWFGGYMSQMGSWAAVDPQEQAQIARNFKFVQQKNGRKMQKRESKINIEEVISEKKVNSSQQWLIDLKKSKTLKQFKEYVSPLLNCAKCRSFMDQVQQLTGYSFELRKYLSNK